MCFNQQREQRSYVDFLVKYAKFSAHSKDVEINKNDYLQYLDMKKHMNEEVTEFLMFLQNSEKKCAQDYNMLSENTQLFTEKILRACIEQNTDRIKVRKNSSALGSVKYVKTIFPSMPIKLQLSKDDMSTIEMPEQTAETMYYNICKDPNAEKLISRYHPETALTSQSLFTLLNYHEPTYKEQWEIPVLIQVIAVAGSKSVKSMSAEMLRLENLYLDFDDDVTELETFGVTTTKALNSPSPASTSTVPNMTDSPTAPKAGTTPVAASAPDISANSRSLSQIRMEQLQKKKWLVTGMDGVKIKMMEFESCGDKASNSGKSLVQGSDLKTSDALQLENSQETETYNKNDMIIDMTQCSENLDNSKEKIVRSEAAKTEDTVICSSDTDEECLIIDTECQDNSDGKTAVVSSNLSSRPAGPDSS
ncbi:Little elongation complex subunit 2 [Plecturocebus cupreus]